MTLLSCLRIVSRLLVWLHLVLVWLKIGIKLHHGFIMVKCWGMLLLLNMEKETCSLEKGWKKSWISHIKRCLNPVVSRIRLCMNKIFLVVSFSVPSYQSRILDSYLPSLLPCLPGRRFPHDIRRWILLILEKESLIIHQFYMDSQSLDCEESLFCSPLLVRSVFYVLPRGFSS